MIKLRDEKHQADSLSIETRVEISERIMREIGAGFFDALGIGGTMGERGIRDYAQRAIDRALGLTDDAVRCGITPGDTEMGDSFDPKIEEVIEGLVSDVDFDAPLKGEREWIMVVPGRFLSFWETFSLREKRLIVFMARAELRSRKERSRYE